VDDCSNHVALWRVDITNNAAGLNDVQQQALPNNRRLLNDDYPGFRDASHKSTVAVGDWAFVATESLTDSFGSGSDDGSGQISPWHPYRQEIIGINAITGEIRRLAHHRSRTVDPHCGEDESHPPCDYYSFPRLSAGWRGKVVGFASNFNQPGSGRPVVDIYAIPLAAAEPGGGPLAGWALDEGSGTTAGDDSGHGHTGTLVGGPAWTPGHSGQGLSLDGVDDFVEVPHRDDLNAFPLTITAWLKTTTTARAGIVNKYVAASFLGYNLFTENGLLCAWYFRDSSNHTWDGSLCTLAVAGANDGQWHHVAFVVDGDARLYLDGVRGATQPWVGSAGPTTTTQPVSLGRYAGASTPYFQGSIDEVRIYDRALSEDEIRSLAQ
jgi:hypothetical protein